MANFADIFKMIVNLDPESQVEHWPSWLKKFGEGFSSGFNKIGDTVSDAFGVLTDKAFEKIGSDVSDTLSGVVDDAIPDYESVSGIVDYINGLMSSVGAENEANRTFNSDEAAKQREWQSEENAINRQWQTDMSNSAYQRMTADLKAAGLNPILAATNGATSTPSGVVGAGSSASYNVGGGDTFSSILNSIGGVASAISQFLPANKVVQVIKSFAKATK